MISLPGALASCWLLAWVGMGSLNGVSVETGKANTAVWAPLAWPGGAVGGGAGAWVFLVFPSALSPLLRVTAFLDPWPIASRGEWGQGLVISLLGDTFTQIFPCPSTHPAASALPVQRCQENLGLGRAGPVPEGCLTGSSQPQELDRQSPCASYTPAVPSTSQAVGNPKMLSPGECSSGHSQEVREGEAVLGGFSQDPHKC